MKILILSDFVPDNQLKLSDSFNRLIEDADCVIFNLEGSPQLPLPDKNVTTQIMPFQVEEIIHFITSYGKEKFHLALANNHILDNGLTGFDYLRQQLDKNGIKYFGTKDKPYSIHGNVAFLNLVTSETVAKKSIGEKRLNYLFYDTRKINQQIKYLESQTEKLVFYPHWGRDMDTSVFKTFKKKLHFEKPWLVFGHHPHVISGVGKREIYSMGNTYIPHPYYFKNYPASHYGLAVFLDSESMQYELFTTELSFEEEKYLIKAYGFSGLNTAVTQHGKNYGKLKKLFLKMFEFKGNAFDLIKLRFLQTLTSFFSLKYKLTQKK